LFPGVAMNQSGEGGACAASILREVIWARLLHLHISIP
jgi:hypothetical protein